MQTPIGYFDTFMSVITVIGALVFWYFVFGRKRFGQQNEKEEDS